MSTKLQQLYHDYRGCLFFSYSDSFMKKITDTLLLHQAVNHFGHDFRSIQKYYFPTIGVWNLQRKLAKYNVKRESLTFADDLLILDRMLNKENTIDTLAKLTNVSVYKLLYRSMKIIKELNMMRLEFPNTDDQTRLLRYRAILKDYLEKNPDKLNIPQQVPYPSTNLRFEWTDQDKFKLKSLARKLEYAWPLLVYDFPTSAQEIQTEYNRLFDRVVFTPADDQQILDWMSKKYSSASRYNTLHHQCFPNRSIGSLKYRHRYLRKNRTILTPEEVKRISNEVAEHGRYAFHVGLCKIPDIKVRRLILMWAFYEPIDQVNGLWTFETDLKVYTLFRTNDLSIMKELMSEFPHFSVKELQYRYQFLSTTSEPLFKSRVDEIIKQLGNQTEEVIY